MQNPTLYGSSKGQKSLGVPLWGKKEMSSALNQDPSALPTPTFQADFTSSITPQIGTGGTFTRSTVRNYWSGATTLAQVAIDTPAIPAYQFANDSVGGLGMWGPTTNYALQSEDIATTWSAVGTVTRTAVVGTGYGGINFGSLTADTGEGITQTMSFAAASTTVQFSFYAVALTSPVTVNIVVEGDSGGTPETQTTEIIIVPTNLTQPARYYNPALLFTAGATGNVKVSVLLQETGSILIGGLMVERKETDGSTDQHLRIPGPYVKTTTAEVSHAADVLTYPASNITNTATMTWHFWVNTDFRGFNNSTPYRDMSPSADDKYVVRSRDASNNVIIEIQPGRSNNFHVGFNGGTVTTLYERHYDRRWHCYTITADYTGSEFKIYRNGVLYATDTTAFAAPGAANDFYVGSFTSAYRSLNGIIRNLKYYDRVLTAAEVAAVFNSEYPTFLETTYKHGWPLQPNWHDPYTTLFFDFSEASGSLVDEIHGTTLTVSGSPTFGQVGTGRFAALTGVTYTTGAAHRNLTGVTRLNHDLSATNHVLSMWIQKTSTVGEQNMLTLLGHGSSSDYGVRFYFLDDLTIRMDLQADDGSTKNCSWTLSQSLVDGQPHQLWFHWGQNTLGKLWVGRVRHATENDDDAGTTYTNEGIRVGEKYDGSGDNFIGTIWGIRYSFAAGDAAVTMTNTSGPISLGSE